MDQKLKTLRKPIYHDGVIQLKPDGSVGDLVAYDSHQIKSATGNQGTFNPSEPDITKADGGALTDDEGITAYHGSPHDFERFDMSKIGTGEGAQAYGHGLYFAQNEDVARGYRDDLTNLGDDLSRTQTSNMLAPTILYKAIGDLHTENSQTIS